MKIVLAMMMAAWVVVGCKAAKPEDVARQYVQALQAGDPAAFKALLDKKRQRMCYENVFRTIRPEKLEIIKVEPPYIILRYRLPLDKNWPVETGTIYLYPNGKIKYDPIFPLG